MSMIRAELHGSMGASACGMTISANAPVIALCKASRARSRASARSVPRRHALLARALDRRGGTIAD
jgi:hypothetical protein